MNLKKNNECRIFVDYDNNADNWWDNGGRELWITFSGGKYRDFRIATVAEMMTFFAEAEKIPGWTDGPDRAKYPFFVITPNSVVVKLDNLGNLAKGREYMEFRIAVDYENNAEKWWDNGGRELWRKLVFPGFLRDEKIISGEVLDAFIAEAEKIPGWDDGPDHAKYPFCVFDVE